MHREAWNSKRNVNFISQAMGRHGHFYKGSNAIPPQTGRVSISPICSLLKNVRSSVTKAVLSGELQKTRTESKLLPVFDMS